jgi:hypothetical protein
VAPVVSIIGVGNRNTADVGDAQTAKDVAELPVE